jgi:hypothetical protein
MLLKDLIEIPESVQKSDFVVALADGITRPEQTVNRYVVTPQILECFQRALTLVTSTLADGSSKGAYLHGSFGSGKSHFMAVLHLLLEGDPHARSRPEFAPLIERSRAQLEGRRILLVPYHMVGAEGMESKILGGYVDLIRAKHPEAALPPVYLDHGILEQARSLRQKMGDEAFFEHLGEGGEDDGFGEAVGGWDAERFEAAASAPPGNPERDALVSDFIGSYAPHLGTLTAATGKGFVPLDKGLDAISRHAKGLGYDAVLLFLDELILWFASRMADPSFVAREGPKVAKLVEAAASERPAPIISFIARQRDLRDFVGAGVPGAEAMSFEHTLQFWEGRFDTIELSDTNLREIVRQRVLRPRSEGARHELDQAFERVYSRGGRAMDAHLTSEADKEAFRSVYPFSPALVDTLVSVSNFLQRERTALRLLVQLLASRREELAVGDLIPMGDLFDLIQSGEAPFSDQLARHLTRTRALYERKFRPLLLGEHSLRDEDVAGLPATHPFRTQDRLVKTLLLAALLGDQGPLRNMTASRLADLNHGTIRSPIAGQERSIVLTALRRWAPDVPELRIGDDPQDPSVSLQISGVDVQAILDQAAAADSTGARQGKIREMVQDALGVKQDAPMLPGSFSWTWRGSRRKVEVQFGNVRDERDLPSSAFRASDVPKVIIDYPFDEGTHGPTDDKARVDKLREELGPNDTVAWLPAFFTDDAMERLGRLVILDHLLTGERLDSHVQGLTPTDRVEARNALLSMQQAQREEVRKFIRQAYAVENPEERWIQSGFRPEDQFPTLNPTLHLQPPTAPDLRGALEQLLDRVMASRYPAHPVFESLVSSAELRTALEYVRKAVGDPKGRADVAPGSDRTAVRKVLAPLELAIVGEGHIVLRRDWLDRFRVHEAQIGGAPVTVERLHVWIDEPRARGLDTRVSNLVILAFALQDDRVFLRAGVPVEPTIENLDPQMELRTQALPSEEDWVAARPRAQAIFGVTASPVRNAANVVAMARTLKTAAEAHRDACTKLAVELGNIPAPFRAEDTSDRRRSAETAAKLLRDLLAAGDADAARVLAAAEVHTSEQALGRSIKSAPEILDALGRTNWKLMQSATELSGDWAARAGGIRTRLCEVISRDELAQGLRDALRVAESTATALLGEAAGTRPSTPATPQSTGHETPAPVLAPEPLPGGTEVVREARSVADARKALDDLAGSDEAHREIEAIEIRVRYRT